LQEPCALSYTCIYYGIDADMYRNPKFIISISKTYIFVGQNRS
jgi:hypothetical protein